MKQQDNKNIEQNLRDAGVDSATIKKFLCLEKQGKSAEQLRILAKYRETLLNIYHEDQKKIDCLDFLIFNIRQRRTSENQKVKEN